MRNPPSRDLLRRLFGDNHEMIIAFESLYVEDNNFQDALNAIQLEIDRIETGVGLETDGTYIAPTGTNYLDLSTSVMNALVLLDTASSGNTKIINIDTNYAALNESQIIIADCGSGDINVTLPNPSTFNVNGYSRNIGITKKDISLNIVNILPYAGENIVGESSQTLELVGEVLNFITDGTEWYLGA